MGIAHPGPCHSRRREAPGRESGRDLRHTLQAAPELRPAQPISNKSIRTAFLSRFALPIAMILFSQA
jgi:hypothetical protein